MAVIIIDGFDHYTYSQGQQPNILQQKWGLMAWHSFFGGQPATYVIDHGGRNGSGYLQMKYVGCQYGQYYYVGRILPAARSLIVFGFALRWTRLSNYYEFQNVDWTGTPYDFHFCSLQRAGSPVAGARLSAGNFITIDGGAGGVLAQTSVPVITDDVWQYVEVKFDLAGQHTTVRVNNATVLNASAAFPNTLCDTVFLGHIGGKSSFANFPNWQYDYDDVYVLDNVGGNVDFLGDVLVQTLFPIGPGASSNWSPSPGTMANWDCVNDDPTPDGDVTNVNSDAVGTIDTYKMQQLAIGGVGGTIKAVQWDFYVHKYLGGSRLLAPMTRLGGVEAAGPEFNPYPNYTLTAITAEVNPLTAGFWVPNDFNNATAEHGFKVSS